MAQVERVWPRRLRWRLRGAWQWPAFMVLTLVDGVLLFALPPWGDGPPGVFPGVLLAAFLNLIAVAVVAPFVGWLVRRRRPDLPRLIASDYAGAWLLAAITVAILAGGLVHRSATAAESRREAAVARAMHDYVVGKAPGYAAGLRHIDAVRIEPDHYRACIPGRDERHALCLFVRTGQHPPGITVDTNQEPNALYRQTVP
ncbi:MAG TPA: hypothetical protein VFM58_21970 [Solirubrobacteraceae bacterium]|nr:hypothetical protein [Solirubrobacteraceae bacterium]